MKKITYYSVYYINTEKNDIEYIKEFNDINDLVKEYNLKNKKSIYHYIVDSLDCIKDLKDIKNTLKNKYIIFKDSETL
jgi:hypothetical protein